ncbi:HslU--HslV peptidase proteolytic subunit, partial [Vibrio parahaemolyticus]|nr:HslU--HslV peptidase proteolytic subunit [Vibrio parahaemolyticus]
DICVFTNHHHTVEELDSTAEPEKPTA